VQPFYFGGSPAVWALETVRSDTPRAPVESPILRALCCSATLTQASDARLVVLGIDHAYTKEPDNAAVNAAKAMLEMRGNTPRLFQNTLIFLAIDQVRLQDLDEAVRRYLAWESILADTVPGRCPPLQL